MRSRNAVLVIGAVAMLICARSSRRQGAGADTLRDSPARMKSADQMDGNKTLAESGPAAQKETTQLPAGVFAGLSEHPRTPLVTRAKATIETISKKGNSQYVRCQLDDGKILIGPITSQNDEDFELQTGVYSWKTVRYSELASLPQPVAGSKEKFVRGAGTTGAIILVILALPFLLPYYAIACAGGSCAC
jgi:hypothetical protein